MRREVACRFVTHIDADSLHVALGPTLKGRVGLLDMSPDPAKLDSLAKGLDKAFSLGQPLKCRVDKVTRRTPYLIGNMCSKLTSKQSSVVTLRIWQERPSFWRAAAAL